MPKRKADDLLESDTQPRRSDRRKPAVKEEAGSASSARKLSKSSTATHEKKKPRKASKEIAAGTIGKDGGDAVSPKKTSHPAPAKTSNSKTSSSPPATSRQYWLMKAEPESRLESGHDIKFSIDDLASKTEPEPWDGIRSYPARNNLRAMKKGDLAFFYHSSCKVPAIVGIMEIVQEHSPDLSAHDPQAPYYDPKSDPSSPKWSVVHVVFRQKLKTPITLKELREFQAEKGSPLENMQMLKLGRLSVSRVSAEEWAFLVGVMEKNGDSIDVS